MYKVTRTDAEWQELLTPEEYAVLRDAVTDPWRPLVEFLVASGARWGEAVALRPDDVAAHSNVLLFEQYRSGVTPAGLARSHA